MYTYQTKKIPSLLKFWTTEPISLPPRLIQLDANQKYQPSHWGGINWTQAQNTRQDEATRDNTQTPGVGQWNFRSIQGGNWTNEHDLPTRTPQWSFPQHCQKTNPNMEGTLRQCHERRCHNLSMEHVVPSDSASRTPNNAPPPIQHPSYHIDVHACVRPARLQRTSVCTNRNRNVSTWQAALQKTFRWTLQQRTCFRHLI